MAESMSSMISPKVDFLLHKLVALARIPSHMQEQRANWIPALAKRKRCLLTERRESC